MHHFIAICEFKLKLQSGNAHFGSKSAIYCPPVTLKFDGWPWKTAEHLFYVAWRFMHHSIVTSEFKQKLQPRNAQYGWKSAIFVLCDHKIWWMTLKNNRAPRLCYFKLCASFHSHWWIQTGVTVRKCPIWIQINDFFSHVTLKFEGWHEKQKGTSPKQHQALCIISSSYVNSNWSYSPETAKLGYDLSDLDL